MCVMSQVILPTLISIFSTVVGEKFEVENCLAWKIPSNADSI